MPTSGRASRSFAHPPKHLPLDTPPAASQPLPTPDVAPPAPTPQAAAPSPELLARVDALASRVDQLATDKTDWKPQLEKVAELLRARLEHLEEAVSRRPEGAAHEVTEGGNDGVRAEIAALASRIEAIPTQTHEWRYELSQVAENLRTRLEHVETSLEDAPAGGQLAELRTLVDRLSERIDSLPTPSEEWHHGLVDLAARMDALPVPSDEWRDAFADLSARIDSLPAPSEEWRQAVAELSARMDALPVPSDEWRDAFAELSARIDSLPAPSEEWRHGVAELSARVDALPVSSDEWRDVVSELAVRIDALPVDAWRSEFAEVAESLRTRVERVEHGLEGATGSEELAELRASLDALSARVGSLPLPSEEWRDEIDVLAARIDALPVSSDEWRDAVADLSARIDSLPAPSEEWRHDVAELSARMDALPVSSEEWRDAVADLSARIDSLPLPSEEWRDEIDVLAARIDALPVSSDEWRGVVSELAVRIDALPVDAWRSEFAEVAESLRARVERVEHDLEGTTGSEELAELRAALDALSARVGSLLVSSDEWRHAVSSLEQKVAEIGQPDGEAAELRASLEALVAKVDSLPVDGWRSELAEVAESLRTRVERVEHDLEGATGSEELAELRASLDALSARVGSLPLPSEDGAMA